ncbi:hypothetical protein SNE40_014087 [Patella caerulea]|uniref:Uncharacterized protein n=1 Tax=Patella caerulea TaxID=87958 RepID=A0AAN8JHH0_PATCE
MNWIGGARHRVSCHGEKKLQKEYFERKRRTDGIYTNKHGKINPPQNFSQDLAALRTVNRAFIHPENGEIKNVRKVDLKGYRSTVICQNKLEEVDLPHSPNTTPSKLMLNEATDDQYTPQKLSSFIKQHRSEDIEKNSLFSYHVNQCDIPSKKRPQSKLTDFSSLKSSSKNQQNFPKEISSHVNSGMNIIHSGASQSSSKQDEKLRYMWASEDFQTESFNKYDIDQHLQTPISYHTNLSMNEGLIKPPIMAPQNLLSGSSCFSDPGFSASRLNPLKPNDSFLDDQICMYKTPNKIPDKTFLYHAPRKSPTRKTNYTCTSQSQKTKQVNGQFSIYDADSESTPMKRLCSASPKHTNTIQEIKQNFENQQKLLNLSQSDFKFQARNSATSNGTNISRPLNSELSSGKATYTQGELISRKQTKNNLVPHIVKLAKKSISFASNLSDVGCSTKDYTKEQDIFRLETPMSPTPLPFELMSDDSDSEECTNNIINIKEDMVKKTVLLDKPTEMDEVLAELSQLEHESDKEANHSSNKGIGKVLENYIQKRQESPSLQPCITKRKDMELDLAPVISSDTERETAIKEILETIVHSVVITENNRNDYPPFNHVSSDQKRLSGLENTSVNKNLSHAITTTAINKFTMAEDNLFFNRACSGKSTLKNRNEIFGKYLDINSEDNKKSVKSLTDKEISGFVRSISTQTTFQPMTKDISLSPILIPSGRIMEDVAVQWEPPELDYDSESVSQTGCFEVSLEESKEYSPKLKDTMSEGVEKFSSELIFSSQESFIQCSQNVSYPNSYALRSRQKC